MYESGGLTRERLADAARNSAGRDSSAAKEGLLDLLLYCVRLALADHDLTDSEMAALKWLARVFRVEEGELLDQRREEVAELVGVEMRRILLDRQVDAIEAGFKVRLQEALGLSYDQFLELSKAWVEETVTELFEMGAAVEGSDIHWLQERIANLDTVFDLDGFLDRQVADVLAVLAKAGRAIQAGDVPARSISQDVKDMVWRRDQGRCTQCGSNHRLEFDHIIPYVRGGSNTYRNIQLLCEACNRRKSDSIG
jgi:hypothetical protein